MKLNILERIVAIQVIEEFRTHQANFITFKTMNSLRDKLFVNEEEVKKYELRIEDNNYKWNDLGFTEQVEIDITEAEKALLVKQLITMDKENKLVNDHVSLVEKCIPNPEEVLSKVE